MDFEYSCARISSSMGWTSMLQALLRPLFGQICLELVFLCFIFILRKAYRCYIPVSRDFYSSLGLNLLVDGIMRFRSSYITYIGNPTSPTSMAHALEASALGN